MKHDHKKDEDITLQIKVPLFHAMVKDSMKYGYEQVKAVAGNNSNVYLLEIFSRDEDELVRGFVAGNVHASHSILQRLSEDVSHFVRECVAGNPNTPRRVLEVLYRSESECIRREVARNENTPIYILKILKKDTDTFVRHYATEILGEEV